MIVAIDGTEIRYTDPHRHKFDSAMAEYLWTLELHGLADDTGGAAEAPDGWFARFGRWMLHGDSRGFVWCRRYRTEAEAVDVFDEMTESYQRW